VRCCRQTACRAGTPPALIPLSTWFRDLAPAAASHGGLIARAAKEARGLLADPRERVVLHGDIHHDNILDFGTRGWLAIDPKGLQGERGFDYANLFCNPRSSGSSRRMPISPDRFAARLQNVAQEAGLQRERLLQWILAWTGLSAAWSIGDAESPEIALSVGALAMAELDR
jgi:streptomycin 6-kinase